MTFDPNSSLALVTADLSGIGGRIKAFPEDFEVEEIPAYEPSGQGEFLYLWTEKRGMGAEYFIREIARRLNLSPADIGTAGLKDRQAVTRQMVSVPVIAESRLQDLESEGIRVLRVSRHGNKLRPGHLHGNRFNVLVRDVDSSASEAIDGLLKRLDQQGLPNYYGPQRFGRENETVNLGLALLRGERAKRVSPFLRKLALSAAQSALFNHYLCLRISDGLFRQVLAGDVMAKRPFGGLFLAKDLAAEQARFEARETVHTGPIFGRKTFAAEDDAAARESEVLDIAGLSSRSFEGFGKLLQGTRRANLVYVTDLRARVEDDGMRLTFSLPSGSYATVLLREVMKTETLDNKEGASNDLEQS